LNFSTRYDYEEVPSEGAAALVDNLNQLFTPESLSKNEKTYTGSKTGATFTVSAFDNFTYTDPIDGSVSKKQGQIVQFTDGSRVVFRLSGTGSQGATVRMYVERYSRDPSTYEQDTAEGLEGLIEVALEITKLPKYLGRSEPTVITVRWLSGCQWLRNYIETFLYGRCSKLPASTSTSVRPPRTREQSCNETLVANRIQTLL
jgi:phosphoglucomutase